MGHSNHLDAKVSNSYENLTSKSRSRSWNFYWLFAFAAMSLFGAGMVAKTQEAAPLVKVGETKLKHSRYGAAAAVLGDCIYVFGGSTAGAVSSIERINSRTLEVEQVPGKLVARRYHSVIEHDGKFYLFGGQGFQLRGNDPYERSVEIFDPATNAVTNGPAMRRARAFMATAKLGPMGYFIGGRKLKANYPAQTNDVDIFDFITNTWSNGIPMPTPRQSQAAVVGSFLLVPGGFLNTSGVTNVDMFVTQENTWKTLPPLGRRVSAHSLVFLGEHLFLFGDYDELDSILAYNLRTRSSVIFNAGFKGVRHTAAAVCGNKIFIIGGTTMSEDGYDSDLVQVFALNPEYHAK